MSVHKPHELALLLPTMTTDDYERLKADMAANGLLNPITLHEGKNLDGIHRERICEELGIEPRYQQFTGDDPARFVFSQNLARRHLKTGQAAMIAAELAAQIKPKKGRPIKGFDKRPSAEGAAEQAAATVGVSRSSIEKATRIKKERPDLARRVKAGKKTLNAAYEETTGRQTSGHRPRRATNWNGKTNPTRERELRANSKNGASARKDNYNDLLRLSLDMNRACSIIEAYHVDDFDLEATTLDLVDTFHDDLVTLAHWVERALMATQAWLGDVKVRRKIAALRNTTGRTPEETEAFVRLAAKLERKLEATLPSGVS